MKYEDERLLQVEEEKQNQLNKTNEQFNNLLNERQDLTNQQTDLVNKWEQTQNENLDKQLQFQKDLIEQQKQEANKNYENEAKSAYTDYRKENNDYGVSREQQAQRGMMGTGYSESSRVSMYNTYQNRLGSARKSMDKAYLDFNNAIREAQLTNDVNKAENALKSLQNKLTISLEGFNYKDATTKDMMNAQNQISNDYYNRYQNTINQINYENEQEEARRKWEEQQAYQREQDKLAQQRWEQELAYKKEQDRQAQARWQQEMNQRNWEISQRAAAQRAAAQSSPRNEEITLSEQAQVEEKPKATPKGSIKPKLSPREFKKLQSNLGAIAVRNKPAVKSILQNKYRNGELSQTEVTNLYRNLHL